MRNSGNGNSIKLDEHKKELADVLISRGLGRPVARTRGKEAREGNPIKIYSLKVGFNNIITHLENQQRKAVDEAQTRIERLRELGK